MSTRILVAKYVEDIRRWEPRNVGVIVQSGDDCAARFIGERKDGAIDGRKLRWNIDAEAYRGWVSFWRQSIDAGDEGIREALKLSKDKLPAVRSGRAMVGRH